MKLRFNLFKNSILFIQVYSLLMGLNACSTSKPEIVVGANRTETYLPYLEGKRIAIVANQTSVIFKKTNHQHGHTHLVDSLLSLGVNIRKVFAPEHGFRGQADAGETVTDGMDPKTGLPIISLYGKNKKPSAESLKDIDLVLFDIQDVGVRFYTYIATLQLLMQACGEAQIPIFVLDRPNPNIHLVDGPLMQMELSSFLGMTPIPLAYGMTIGEYASMINTEEGWLGTQKHPQLSVVGLKGYTRASKYELPIKPSPNLPDAQAVALYPSLGLFEGTTINAGRGTAAQFTRFGAPELKEKMNTFSYTPRPNPGAKYPKHQGALCYGMDLSEQEPPQKVDLQWIIAAYHASSDPSSFFLTEGFSKHAGNTLLQTQIIKGLSQEEIEATWQEDLEAFKTIRAKYLRY